MSTTLHLRYTDVIPNGSQGLALASNVDWEDGCYRLASPNADNFGASVPAMGRLGPAKCIGNQAQLSRSDVVEVHRNDVEANVPGLLAQAAHVKASHPPDHAPLVGIYGRFGCRHIEAAARLNLNEAQGIPLPADQV